MSNNIFSSDFDTKNHPSDIKTQHTEVVGRTFLRNNLLRAFSRKKQFVRRPASHHTPLSCPNVQSPPPKQPTIKHFILLALPLLLLCSACKRDGLGDLLFEVQYQPIDFVVPSGQTAVSLWIVSTPSLSTGFEQAMMDNDVTAEDIDFVGGFRARVTSLTGEDFSEIERIEIRACEIGGFGGCPESTSWVFTQEDLFGRRQQTINLSPTPKNFKALFLGNDRLTVELTFRAGITTERNLEGRLEWSMAAFADFE